MSEEEFKRRLTAILSADVEGYSRLMREDEEATVRTITTYRTVMTHLIQQHRGRVVDSPGDNILAEFTSVVDAVNCGVEIQRELAERNADLPENRRMQFRIGINMGDVLEEGDRIYGDGVNIAARMESLAVAGEICISGTVYDAIESKIGLEYEYLGEHEVKNIDRPIRAYRVLSYPGAAAHRVLKAKRAVGKAWRNTFLSVFAVILVGAAVAVWHFYFRSPPIEPASVDRMAYPLPDKPSIAVLPFDNMSGDPEQEYFSDGLTEEIITALSKVPDLLVIARNSTFSYKGKPVKVQQVAEELGVRYVLEGSVRKAGDRVRITAQLIDAIKGHHQWAERYERALKDTFSLQDEITRDILSSLAVKLTVGEQAAGRTKTTDNLNAYLKFLQAVWHKSRMTKEGHFLAKKLADEAVTLDPNYAEPYVILAYCHIEDVFFGRSKSPKESLKQALQLAQKALSLDESSPSCHVLLSSVFMFQKQYERAIAEAEQAIALDPNRADAYSMLGTVLHMAGRQQEAIAPLEKAIRINPMAHAIYFRRLGAAYRDIGRYEEAIVQLKKAIRLSPDSLYPHVALASTYSLAGRDEEARGEVSEVLRIQPKISLESLAKRVAYKNKTDTDKIIDALRKVGFPETPPLPLPDKPSIAVLPFVNMSGDAAQEYFSDGIAEEIITALSKTEKLFVIARTSSFKYKGKEEDVRKVGRELGVLYVLEGSVRKSEDRLRITAQLIDCKTGNHVWAHRYDRDLKELFAIQDEITMKIITALQVKLTEGEQARMWGKRIDKLDVYSKFLEARSLWDKGTPKSHARFGQVAQEIIDMDPGVGTGYDLMAWHCWYLAKIGKSPRENIGKAFTFAQKALSIDESVSGTHALLGSLYLLMRQYDKAIAEGERSVELDPNGAIAHGLLGMTLAFSDRLDEAIGHLKQAIRLNPFPPYWYYARLGQSYMQKGEYEEALQVYDKALKSNPEAFSTYAHLAALYVLMDREEDGRAAAKKVLELYPDFSLDRISKTLTFKNKDFHTLFVGAMREAGLQ